MSDKERNIAPEKLVLLITVVQKGKGTFFADIVLTVAVLAVFFMGRKMTGKKLERPEAGTSAGA